MVWVNDGHLGGRRRLVFRLVDQLIGDWMGLWEVYPHIRAKTVRWQGFLTQDSSQIDVYFLGPDVGKRFAWPSD